MQWQPDTTMLALMKPRTRNRKQNGWVEPRGNQWYGYFNQHIEENGKRIRKKRTVVLGERSKLTKGDAKELLRQIIGSASKQLPRMAEQTLAWFAREKFLPSRSNWKASTRETNLYYIEKLILPALGHRAMADLDKFELQIFLNSLAAQEYTFTVVDHCRTMLGAILGEAVDEDLIAKNVAKKLSNPETTERKKETLSETETRRVFDALQGRDKLIAMIAGLCALRPSEIFGLRWSSWQGGSLLIDSTAWRGQFREGVTKTKGSKAPVVIPDAVLPLLEAWKQKISPASPDEFMFASETGGVLRPENWLRRRIKPVVAKLKIKKPVHFQILRRSFATHAQTYCSNPKDLQSQLRHSDIGTTLNVYQQPIPESTRASVNQIVNGILTKLIQ
jgi:integrase